VRFTNTTTADAFSPDGQYLVSAGVDKYRQVWFSLWGIDLDIKQLKGHMGVQCIAFSPDGRYLASGDRDWTIRLWEVATGRQVWQVKGHEHQDSVRSLAFSPDERCLASGGRDGVIRLWEVTTGREIRQMREEERGLLQKLVGLGILCLAFSPDGRYLASTSNDETVRVWEVATGQVVRRLKGREIGWESVAFSPDGQYLASGGGFTIQLWEFATGQEMHLVRMEVGGFMDTLARGKPRVRSVTFSPDGQYLAWGSGDGTVRLWDVATGQEVRQLEAKTTIGVSGIAFSPDGRYLAAAIFPATVQLWEVATGEEVRRLWIQGGARGGRNLAFSPDGRHLAVGGGGEIWLGNVET